MEQWAAILTACAPVLVALVGIIPTVISNGRKTRESVSNTTQEIEKQVSKLQKTLDEHISEDEDEKARNQRYRILRFYDEVCEGKDHSESHWEDILDDIDHYGLYCQNHPKFRNSRGHLAMQHLQSTYARIKADGKFLTHDGE